MCTLIKLQVLLIHLNKNLGNINIFGLDVRQKSTKIIYVMTNNTLNSTNKEKCIYILIFQVISKL